MNGTTLATPDSSPESPWKRYPYVIPGADAAWFTFPAAEGDVGTDANTWFIESRLRGLRSGRQLAVMAIFSAMRVPIAFGRKLRADFFILSLFDLADGSYGTMTEYDVPRPFRLRRSHKLRSARGLLDLSFEGREGRSRWSVRRDAAGAPVPFSYALDLRGRDQRGQPMVATLDVEVGKPPAPVGGDDARGVKTCCAQLGTFSYFQTGLAVAGKVKWGDFEDQVVGDVGWIDRQYARENFSAYTDRKNSRHRHEWRVVHLDNG
ncbi:MAG TPA: secreted hydrolase, partial [Candidatus Binatia bacterium]|nr:secreted hydrolase [Candidatus Binatia bacterium]